MPSYFFLHVTLTDVSNICADMQTFVKSKTLMFSNKYFSSEKQPRRTLFALCFSYVFGNVLITLLRCWRVYQNISVVDIIFRNLVRLLLWIHLQTLFNIFLRDNLFPCSSAWLLLKNIKHVRISFIILSSKACKQLIIWEKSSHPGRWDVSPAWGKLFITEWIHPTKVRTHLIASETSPRWDDFCHESSFCGTVLPIPGC